MTNRSGWRSSSTPGCRFPGDLVTPAGLLLLVNGAMTAICLGISSITKSAEHASLVCVYLVGFQLPLSGAVLALPKFLGWITQPVIAAYWGWSGYLQTMRDTRFYNVIQSVSQTKLAPLGLCGWVLVFPILAGLLLAYLGSRHSRWERTSRPVRTFRQPITVNTTTSKYSLFPSKINGILCYPFRGELPFASVRRSLYQLGTYGAFLSLDQVYSASYLDALADRWRTLRRHVGRCLRETEHLRHAWRVL